MVEDLELTKLGLSQLNSKLKEEIDKFINQKEDYDKQFKLKLDKLAIEQENIFLIF